MNKMEHELRRLLSESDIFYDIMFCGKMAIGKIDKDIRAKIEFTYRDSFNCYDALKVTILNRCDGVIDTTVFPFADIIGLKNGKSPYFWNESNYNRWYGFTPTSNDYDSISGKVQDYMSMFADEDIGYEMSSL